MHEIALKLRLFVLDLTTVILPVWILRGIIHVS